MKPVSLLLASVLAISGASFIAPQPVAAAEDLAAKGAAILKASDDRAVKFPDQTYTASMEIYKSGKLRTTMVFSMVTKGLVKQLIRFLQPGDVAGMKILMEGPDELYVYSPEFQKVRRIAAHMKNQGFNGSEFTPEDMVMARLSPMFDAVLVGKTGNETQLNLKPKVGRLDVVLEARDLHRLDGRRHHADQLLRRGGQPHPDADARGVEGVRGRHDPDAHPHEEPQDDRRDRHQPVGDRREDRDRRRDLLPPHADARVN
jgi:hypothetical protein